MAWLLIEAGLALALAAFIIWWTWPRPKKPEREDPPK
jgi:hypothetical protein